MASITVRNLDESLQQRRRRRAAQHGHSLEEEVHDILRAALGQKEMAPGKTSERRSTSASSLSAA